MIDHRPRTQFTPTDVDGARARFRRAVERALKRVSEEEEEARRQKPRDTIPTTWTQAAGMEAAAMRGRRKRLATAPRVRRESPPPRG